MMHACMQSCHQHNVFNQLPMYLVFEFITIQFWSSFYYFTKYIYIQFMFLKIKYKTNILSFVTFPLMFQIIVAPRVQCFI